MFGLFEAFAKQIEEQTREYVRTQENVRQRAVSGLLDPFQMLQPMRATVESAEACDLQPPRLPAERRRPAKGQSQAKRRQRTTKKRPAPNFA